MREKKAGLVEMMTRCLLAAVFALYPLFAHAREVPITILHTCDLHGNVLPTTDYEGRANLGGIARCATAISRIRQQEKNILLVDAGDTIQGTAVSSLSDGLVMVNLLNHLRYDAWVWGNHEFDWGLEKLATCAERAEMPILGANVVKDERQGTQDKDGRVTARIAARIRPFLVREVDGVKIGIVGLNTPGIPNWSRPRLIGGLRFADSIATLRRVLPELKTAGTQVNVLICHQGYREQGDDHASQIRDIVRNFPEFDVVIGAHTHRDFPEFKIHRTLYCQADYFGIHLGRIHLVYDTDQRRVTRADSTTLLMDESMPLDKSVLDLCSADLDRAKKALGKVIGSAKANFNLSGAPQKETPIHNLLFQSIAAALRKKGVKVDAIMHGILDRRATLDKGPVTVREIWRIVPYENTVGVAWLKPSELREILEEDAAAYGSTMFRGLWGLHWTFDPGAQDGHRVVSLTGADGEPLSEGRRLAVAFNNYDLASGGLRWPRLREIVDRPESKLMEYDFLIREAVIEHVRSRAKIEPVTLGWWKAVKPFQLPRSLTPSNGTGITPVMPQ